MEYAQFSHLCSRLEDHAIHLELNFLKLCIVHGSLKHLMDNPEIEACYSDAFKGICLEIMSKIEDQWGVLGLSEDQVEYLRTQYS